VSECRVDRDSVVKEAAVRRIVKALIGVVSAVLALVVLTPAAPAMAGPIRAAGGAHGGVVSFWLRPGAVATAPAGGMMAEPGDRMVVTGGGLAQLDTGAVHAGGIFVHYRADGTVHCRGTWQATDLTGWTDFGAAPHHRRGGVVGLLVTHHCTTMGEDHTGIPMTVTAAVGDAPATAVTGVTMGEFTVPAGGGVQLAVHGRR
jgi:hypothetical protein